MIRNKTKSQAQLSEKLEECKTVIEHPERTGCFNSPQFPPFQGIKEQ